MKRNFQAVLSMIGKQLNQENILWGVGASTLLCCYNLAEEYHKISIIIAEKDIQKVDKILSALSTRIQGEKTCFYDSIFFCEYKIDGITLDVISGFTICNDGTVYQYFFDEKSIPHYAWIMGEKIPFTTLEEWYILYSMMPQGENNAKLIEKFFDDIGVIYPEVLNRMVKGKLPKHVLKKCNSMLRIS